MDSVSEFLDGVLEDLSGKNPVYEVPPEDRASFRAEVGQLRAIIERAQNSKGGAVLTKLDRLLERFR